MVGVLPASLLLVFPAVMITAAICDLFTMTIPNRISAVLAVAFIVSAPLLGLPLAVIGMHLAAGFAVLLVGIALFSRGWIGGGDAKLAAAASLWFGFGQLMPFLALSAIAGGALTLLVLAFRSQPLPAFAIRQDWVQRLHDRDAGVPYGIAIAAGALMAFPDVPFVRLALG